MDSLHDGVCLEQQLPLWIAALQNRAIVTCADDDRVIRRQGADEFGDEFKLVHGWVGSLRTTSSIRSCIAKLTALNVAWAAMGARRLSVFS